MTTGDGKRVFSSFSSAGMVRGWPGRRLVLAVLVVSPKSMSAESK